MLADLVQHGLSAWWAPALAFAAGVISFASPCVYPLVPGYLAFVTGSRDEGARPVWAFLLFVYSLGLGVPFLLIGLGLRRAMGALEWVKRNYRWIAGVSGVVMVAIGVLLLTGQWSRLLNPFLRWGNRISLPI